MDEDRDYTIRERAYRLWEEDGKPAGRHLDYWLRAERELSSRELTRELEDSFPASDPPSSAMRTESNSTGLRANPTLSRK